MAYGFSVNARIQTNHLNNYMRSALFLIYLQNFIWRAFCDKITSTELIMGKRSLLRENILPCGRLKQYKVSPYNQCEIHGIIGTLVGFQKKLRRLRYVSVWNFEDRIMLTLPCIPSEQAVIKA